MKSKTLAIIAAVWIGLAMGCHSETNTLILSGTLELTEHAVGPSASGQMVTLSVDEGSPVTKGEMIATLDRYQQAKRDYDRLRKLLDSGGTTEQTVEQAKLAVDDQCVVSPIDGVVLVKVHELGEVVAAGSPVAVIGDPNKSWVRIYVPEGKINLVHLDQAVTLRFDGVARDFPGHVFYISPQAEFTPRNVQTEEERVTQTFAVKVALDKPNPYLWPGVSADVVIPLSEP